MNTWMKIGYKGETYFLGKDTKALELQTMKKMILDLPQEVDEQEARLLLAIKLYETSKLSLGQAAKLADFSKATFMELLGKHGSPVYNYSPEELRQEIEQ